MTLYSRDVQTYCSLAHHIKRNQCHVVHFMAVKIDARIIRLLTIFAPPLRALADEQAHLVWNIGRHYEDACKLRNA